MKYGIILRCLIVFALFMFISCVSASVVGNDLKIRAAQSMREFKDLKLTCTVTYCNMAELKKISKDFTQRYEFKTSTVMFKSPDKMKMEGKLGMVKMRMVINGDQKAFIIPAIGYNKKENIKNKPHKRQSDFDMGIFSDTLWDDYIVNKIENERNGEGLVYKITFCRENAKEKKMICWVDAESLKLNKLEDYESNGARIVRYIYSSHKKFGNCIWLPMKIDIYNGEEKHGATIEYEDVNVNTGISDSEFKL